MSENKFYTYATLCERETVKVVAVVPDSAGELIHSFPRKDGSEVEGIVLKVERNSKVTNKKEYSNNARFTITVFEGQKPEGLFDFLKDCLEAGGEEYLTDPTDPVVLKNFHAIDMKTAVPFRLRDPKLKGTDQPFLINAATGEISKAMNQPITAFGEMFNADAACRKAVERLAEQDDFDKIVQLEADGTFELADKE